MHEAADQARVNIAFKASHLFSVPQRALHLSYIFGRRSAMRQEPRSILSARPTRVDSSTRPRAAMSSTSAGGAKQLSIACDYGTSSMRFAYRFHEPLSGHRPSVSDIRDVPFNGEPASPQLLAFKDGQTLFGHQVEEMLLKRDAAGTPLLTHDDIVSFLKVGIYPNLEAEALSQEISGQLERLREAFDLPEHTDAHVIKVHVLAAHLREAYKYVLDQIASDLKSQLQHGHSGDLDLANTNIKFFFSVPGMWTPATNWCITAAAELAGLNNVTLVSEPYAAAAYFLNDMIIQNRKVFSKGARILFIDAGGGTSDVVTFELVGDSTSGATTKMVAVGTADGRLCGSEFINLHFLVWLDHKIEADHEAFPGGKAALLIDMGLSPAEFKDRATRSFASLKHKYHTRQHESYVVHVDGKRGAQRRTISIDIECDQAACNHTMCDQMENFFRPVLQENFDMIRKSLEEDDQIEAIIAMGGFAKSQHFMSRLKAEFGQVQRLRGSRAKDLGDSKDFSPIHIQDGNETMVGFNHPVARGALLRHYEFAHRNLPTQDCFMVAEDAPWDPVKHGPQKHHTIIKGEANPHEDWVKGLSRTIMRAGRRDVESAIWHTRHIGKDDTHQRLQVYWAAREVPEGTPMFRKEDGSGVKGRTVPGIMPCGIPINYALPNMEKLAQAYPKALKPRYPEYILQEERAESNDIQDSAKDADFATSKTSRKRTPSSKDRFGEPIRRRKRGQVRRARSQKPRSCQNCGYDMNVTSILSWADNICEGCASQAFYAIMIRVIVQYLGSKVLLTVEMAKPDHFVDAVNGLPIGPEDVIELHRMSFMDSNFNPNALT
ncbi:hypothetical protein CERZMDRAFT_99517 [Cercospora zeae-maydis SCOH1-5]|uniref:Uncharacterized protein n=1 Tax=Cercospora zeae-maydis SCOH1-5 TaxID=717836 RepID=A0A6A6FAX3_9PEZI|nr:hypothetical protein CERZMDRAFT_99517 [Cercospora zeae-maydis SCOH1-5]